jgi:hypothetical protein
MSARKDAQRAAFSAVGETCPEVDAALEQAGRDIKAQTRALRTALIEAHEQRIDAENERDALQARVDELENEVALLRGEVARLEREGE